MSDERENLINEMAEAYDAAAQEYPAAASSGIRAALAVAERYFVKKHSKIAEDRATTIVIDKYSLACLQIATAIRGELDE